MQHLSHECDNLVRVFAIAGRRSGFHTTFVFINTSLQNVFALVDLIKKLVNVDAI